MIILLLSEKWHRGKMKFTWQEIIDNNYIVINNKVYNVNNFLEEHPGGRSVIENWIGKDATEAFDEVGHSNEALEILKSFYIGELDINSPKIIKRESNGTIYALSALLIVIVSICIYFIFF